MKLVKPPQKPLDGGCWPLPLPPPPNVNPGIRPGARLPVPAAGAKPKPGNKDGCCAGGDTTGRCAPAVGGTSPGAGLTVGDGVGLGVGVVMATGGLDLLGRPVGAAQRGTAEPIVAA